MSTTVWAVPLLALLVASNKDGGGDTLFTGFSGFIILLAVLLFGLYLYKRFR